MILLCVSDEGFFMTYPRRDFFALSQGALLPLLAGGTATSSVDGGRPLLTLSFDNVGELRSFSLNDGDEQAFAVVLGVKLPFDGGGLFRL